MYGVEGWVEVCTKAQKYVHGFPFLWAQETIAEGKPRRFHMDGFGRSLDRGYEANTKTATIRSDRRIGGPLDLSPIPWS